MSHRAREQVRRRATARKTQADYRVERVEQDTYRVERAGGTAYIVRLDAQTCTCPDFSRRLSRRPEYAGVWCKHLHLCAASFLR